MVKDNSKINFEEGILNLLIINLLKQGVNPKILELATGIPEKTIRNKFPMKLIKNEESTKNS